MQATIRYHKKNIKSYKGFVLGADIGGTNSNIGVFGIEKEPELLFSLHFKSQELNSIMPPLLRR